MTQISPDIKVTFSSESCFDCWLLYLHGLYTLRDAVTLHVQRQPARHLWA